MIPSIVSKTTNISQVYVKSNAYVLKMYLLDSKLDACKFVNIKDTLPA